MGDPESRRQDDQESPRPKNCRASDPESPRPAEPEADSPRSSTYSCCSSVMDYCQTQSPPTPSQSSPSSRFENLDESGLCIETVSPATGAALCYTTLTGDKPFEEDKDDRAFFIKYVPHPPFPLDQLTSKLDKISLTDPTSVPQKHKLLLLNVPHQMNYADIARLFARYDPLYVAPPQCLEFKKHHIRMCKVYFSRPEDAYNAKEKLNGSIHYGLILTVKVLGDDCNIMKENNVQYKYVVEMFD